MSQELGDESSKHRAAFEVFAGRVQEELGEDLHRLILYGSVARGEETEESDVDVFVVVEDEEQVELIDGIAFDIGVEYGVLLIPIVKTVEEYRSVKDTVFGREVQETGEVYV